jgi:hypothetical protein
LLDATSVNIIQSAATNVVFPVTGLALSNSTAGTLNACAPSQMKTGTTYQVSVTTPGGTSAAFPLGTF